MNTSPLKRILSIVLTVAMVFSMSGMTAFADEGTLPLGASTILDCHTEHDDDCGYIEAVAAADCTHEHDELCGFVVGTEEIPCDMDCTDTDDDGIVDHAEGCAYTEATESTPCTHEHDDNCGYAEAVTGAECTHEHDELCEEKDTPTLLGITSFAITTHPVTSEAELTAAIASAATGDTIQLTADFGFANNITFPAGKVLVLDLNGKTLTGDSGKTITIAATAKLTITDSGSGGTLSGMANTSERTFVINNGTLNINDGTVSNAFVSVVKNSGTFNLSGGTLSKLNESVNPLITNNSAGSFQYSGGTLLVGGAATDIIENNGGAVKIDGLNFVKTEPTTRVIFNLNDGSVNIKNSTIRVGDPGNTSTSSVLVNNDGTATITNCTISASGGSSQAISNGGTATIENSNITCDGTSTIDNAGTLEITGGKVSLTTVHLTGTNSIIFNSKDLTIHSGIFTSIVPAIRNMSSGKTIIENGVFASKSQYYPTPWGERFFYR